LATAKETPKIAFAPKFDLFGVPSKNHHLINLILLKNRNTYKFLSDNRIYILHRIQTPFRDMLFHHHEALQLHARQLMRPKALQLFLKLRCL
jgi:hypothetical protein